MSESIKETERLEFLKELPDFKTTRLPRYEMDREFPEINHQGLVLRFKPGKSPFPGSESGNHQKSKQSGKPDNWKSFIQGPQGLLLALDSIQDPGNLGAIIRSAEVLGVRAVFLTGKGAGLTPAAVRSSAGAAFHIPLYILSSPDRLLDHAREKGYWILTAAGDEDASRTPDAPAESERESAGNSGQLSGQTSSQAKGALRVKASERSRLPAANECLLFIGNEGDGVRPLIRKKSDFHLGIPMTGKTGSLNASVAAAILLDRLLN